MHVHGRNDLLTVFEPPMVCQVFGGIFTISMKRRILNSTEAILTVLRMNFNLSLLIGGVKLGLVRSLVGGENPTLTFVKLQVMNRGAQSGG